MDTPLLTVAGSGIKSLSHLTVYQSVCALFYGHPTVFTMSGLSAVKKAKALGYHTQILPGISAADCLFADLEINPSDVGCYFFDSTDFLIHTRSFDAKSHLILWQPSMIGAQKHASNHDNQKGIQVLTNYLLGYYPKEHTVILYEAAQYPGVDPIIRQYPLKDLTEATFSGVETLYIPPYENATLNQKMVEALGIDLAIR
jgi:tetrapyrrole methylase family protein/MazG family protein